MWSSRICLSFVVLWVCELVSAVSAYPGMIRYHCSDGSYVNLRLKGDEYSKWAMTEDGYVLLRDSLGEWCYADVDIRGNIYASRLKISALRSKGVDDFLKNISGKIKPGMIGKELLGKTEICKNSVSRSSVVGEQRTLVVLMQYRDVLFKKTREDYDALFNEIGYQKDGALGSVKDFFRENSYGKLDLDCDILGPFTTLHDMKYYGGNDRRDQDQRPEEIFLEALEKIVEIVKLSDYDSDGDGVINNIHLIFSGYGEEAGAEADAVWSHEAIFAEPIEMDGVKIKGYSCAPELRGNNGNGISRIGVHCHEMGHSFGALDFYDTDYDKNGAFSGTGKWDLMASGSWNNEGVTPAHFNPYVKMQFGWVECETLNKEQDKVVLPPAVGNSKIYRINTSVEGDFFLLENRQQLGFDKSIPGNGLMVYHILPDIVQRSIVNKINAAFPQTCYPVCAGTEYGIPDRIPFSYGDVDSPKCPFPGSSLTDEFTSMSVPAALAADGSLAQVGLTNIRQEENGDVSFKVSENGTVVEQSLLFSDSFENAGLAWAMDNIKGNISWSIYKPDLTTMMPVAMAGEHYLAMRGERVSGDLSVSRIASPVIAGSYGEKILLSFYYQNLKFMLKYGTLNVLYKEIGKTNWQYVETLSKANDEWELCQINLPVTGANFQVAFEGEMEAGLLLIDDVRIYSDAATSASPIPMKPASLTCCGMRGKVCVKSDESVRFRIYDLTGKIVYSGTLEEGLNTIEMDPGLYIGVSEKAVSKFSVY
ncbi:M6 family metalloprotease domain-containing protein [Parabacteroides johnsonii]|uniref:M6 family metalloprotease domain-containing protein n=1 Tax=Parabacteroides johnsonii TaxID=387661 RepID=UPI00189C2645|nr:M6 family metalloprotease domain-containing protein [Parabacteroides johnsonii]